MARYRSGLAEVRQGSSLAANQSRWIDVGLERRLLAPADLLPVVRRTFAYRFIKTIQMTLEGPNRPEPERLKLDGKTTAIVVLDLSARCENPNEGCAQLMQPVGLPKQDDLNWISSR